MERVHILVSSKLNNIDKNEEFLAIKDQDVIKYNDFENNKMTIDMQNHIIIRENNDYLFTLNFIDNKIDIYIKKLGQTVSKEIKTLLKKKSNKRYIIRYLLNDENIINEYFIKY